MDLRKSILLRVYITFLLLVLAAGGIVYQTVKVKAFELDKWRSMADSFSRRWLEVTPPRGNIYAVDGSLLATSLPIYDIRFDPNAPALTDKIFYKELDSLCWHLSRFTGKSAAQWKTEIVRARRQGSRYHLLLSDIKFPELKVISEWPIFRRGRYKGGFIAEEQKIRVMPFRQLARRTIGYVKDSTLVGIEGGYNEYLGGSAGRRLMQRIAGGVWLPVNEHEEIVARPGLDVVTTLDLNIQDVAHQALLEQLIRHDAGHGSVILMEVATGEIRAMVNLSRLSQGVYAEAYNYAIGESQEPGSTFKLATAIALLEDGYIRPQDSVDTRNGVAEFYDMVLRDSKEGGHGKITMKDAFAYSSNVAFSELVNHYYQDKPNRFIEHLKRMHLDQALDLNIAGSGVPRINTPKDPLWSGVSLPFMAVGYEVAMTPLQMLTLYNAVANNGVMVAPRLVREVRHLGRTHTRFETQIIDRSICSQKTLEKVREMLEAVVQYGTASNLNNTVYRIAGKTGTAQIAEGRGGYKKDGAVSYQASFAGYFPADRPLYSCIVVVNAPNRSVYYGNVVAGPIFREIADKVYATSPEMQTRVGLLAKAHDISPPLGKRGWNADTRLVYKQMGIPLKGPEGNGWIRPWLSGDTVYLKDHELPEGLVPDVTGMGLQDALYLCENMGLDVQARGAGRVYQQSLPPGTRLGGKNHIELYLH